MGLFDEAKPKVSKDEFDKNVRMRLSNHGFTREELDRVSMIFRSDLDEPEALQSGIDAGEVARAIEWMRAHTTLHRISTTKIDILERVLREAL